MEMLVPDEKSRKGTLQKMLYVPKLAHNLVSVSRAAQTGKDVKFNDSGCEFVNSRGETIASAARLESLYYLEFS